MHVIVSWCVDCGSESHVITTEGRSRIYAGINEMPGTPPSQDRVGLSATFAKFLRPRPIRPALGLALGMLGVGHMRPRRIRLYYVK